MEPILFYQTRSGLSAEYTATYNGITHYTAYVPINYAGYCADLFHNGERIFQLRWNSTANAGALLKSESDKGLAVYDIIDSSNRIRGNIRRKISKNKFFGYYFFEMSFDNEIFTMYEVGLGKEGIKLPIYNGSNQFALIEKEIETINNNDRYTIHSHLGSELTIATLFTLYYDYLRFGHHGEFSSSSKKSFYLFSTNKELKSKYNPKWMLSAE